jgi:hypothetical protein
MRSDDASIFKPSGNAWLPGKCDQTMRAFSSQAVTLGCPENAIRWCEHFQAKRQGLAARKMRSDDASIFKPSGKAWRLGKCDQMMRAFSSQAARLGCSEDAIKRKNWRRLAVGWRS